MAQGQKKLLIEGWRGLPHSYAMVNQFQILELLKRPEISIAHRDLPYLAPHWKPVGGLFSVEQERQIAAIRMPGEGERFDALYRIGGRIDLRDSPQADRTVVFTTAEFRMIPREYTFDNRSIAETLAESAATIVTPSNWSRQGLLASGSRPSGWWSSPTEWMRRSFRRWMKRCARRCAARCGGMGRYFSPSARGR